MLARGIRSYHRPARLDEALDLARQGVVPLAGGTRLLATPIDVPNVMDLGALDLNTIEIHDGDLVLGPMVTLQDLIDSPLAYPASGGLLPAACRAQSVSRMIRSMATVGGESVAAAHDSEVAAALLALNTVFVVATPDGPQEIPALRFLRKPAEDLAGGGLLKALVVPGAPEGAALERVAVLPSAPPLLAVAVGISFAGSVCARARIAFTGLETPPARVLEAESRLEGTSADDRALERCVEQVVARAPFRSDAHASAAYRRGIASTLTLRALRAALERARSRAPIAVPRARPALPRRAPTTSLPYFTSGRVELTINGAAVHPDAEARTTLLELLRNLGYRGAKHGCETGECGACAVLLDGRPVNACLTLALRAHGRSVQTVEGLGVPDALDPVQAAFVETGAIQCGYCTPAMELCARALLDAVPEPTEEEVRDALAGCLCRCTGYVKPVQAVLKAAEAQKGR
jgi:aerobic-type carbon monoxide dehydrogenase small subunit (CoxS/CutS family)/CO/xanthine dehydrogenase FAD-binding subunit